MPMIPLFALVLVAGMEDLRPVAWSPSSPPPLVAASLASQEDARRVAAEARADSLERRVDALQAKLDRLERVHEKPPATRIAPGEPPAAPPGYLWTVQDAQGATWQHADKRYLESWVAQRNASFTATQPAVTYTIVPMATAPTYTVATAPTYTVQCGANGCYVVPASGSQGAGLFSRLFSSR